MVCQFELDLPDRVKSVEGHLTWIPNLIPYLERSALQKVDNLKGYLEVLMKEEFANQLAENGDNKEDPDEEDRTTDNCHIISGLVAMKLNVVAFQICLGDYDAARRTLADVQKILESLEKEPTSQMPKGFRDCLGYCVSAAEYHMKGMEYEITGCQDKISSTQLFNEQQKLIRRFKNNRNTFLDSIAFFQGCLGAALRIKDGEVLMKFEEAIRGNPDSGLWYHFAYRKVRRIRRSSHTTGRFRAPNEKEIEYCKMANKLEDRDPVIILDFALLMKELLWYEPASKWQEDPEKVISCVDAFEKAIQVLTSDDCDLWYKKKWIRKATILYGEFLLFGKYDGLDQEKGKELLDNCIKEFQKSSVLLHKLAKLHHWGLPNSRKFRDFQKAKDFYYKGLKVQPTNYPCFIDYAKFLSGGKQYRKLLASINKFLTKRVREEYQVSLTIDQGIITWVLNPFDNPSNKRDACKSWIQVLLDFPNNAANVYNAIKNEHKISFLPQLQVELPIPDVVATLEELKGEIDSGDELVVIDAFIKSLDSGESKPKTLIEPPAKKMDDKKENDEELEKKSDVEVVEDSPISLKSLNKQMAALNLPKRLTFSTSSLSSDSSFSD